MLLIAMPLSSCLPPGTPEGPFPKNYKTKRPLYVYSENHPKGRWYWIDSAHSQFQPNNHRCSEIAFLPTGSPVEVVKVWSPLEFLAPGDFKMRCVLPHGKEQFEVEMWMTIGNFNGYFSEQNSSDKHAKKSMKSQ